VRSPADGVARSAKNPPKHIPTEIPRQPDLRTCCVWLASVRLGCIRALARVLDRLVRDEVKVDFAACQPTISVATSR
jgi:hypothetical protein